MPHCTLKLLTCLLGVAFTASPSLAAEPNEYDLVIYGGTAGGITAAISASRAGASVQVLEPSSHIGGMVTGGLGRTDLGISDTIGGIAEEFYRRIKQHYDRPEAWKFETREQYLQREARAVSGDRWWFHEPSVASKLFKQMMSEAGVSVLTNHKLVAVEKQGARITSIQCDNGAVFAGRVFIDATYEGDLLAKAGVSYHVGRESTAQYGEKFAGVLPRKISTRKQWDVDVSPYDENGKLLWSVKNIPRGEVGAGDHKVQAYNFRICLTDAPENRVPITEPANYDPTRYDLLARYIAAKPSIKFPNSLLKMGKMPNRKTDINDGGPFSTDFIGFNWDYPGGDDQTRREILQLHIDYTKGLLYFLGHDPRVPQHIRNDMLQWGYPQDEYTQNNHWSPQLYIREARRMVGTYVMTSHDIEENRIKEDSIGMGSYGADSHLVQRIVDGEFVRNEGNPNDFTPGHRPYEIPYRAITPRRDESDNLLATFCVSASHMAFASIRMEPQFMILSESAGLAAVIAARDDVAVHDVPYSKLQPQLVERQQHLKLDELPTRNR